MALKGHGATVRYVTLPYEAHGYLARESNLHVLAETIAWLDKMRRTRHRESRPTVLRADTSAALVTLERIREPANGSRRSRWSPHSSMCRRRPAGRCS